MPAETGKEKGVLTLDEMAKTPNIKRNTLKEKIAEDERYKRIRLAERNKYTHAEIAVALGNEGIAIKPETLGLYLREIAKERGEVDAKQTAGRKPNKARTTAATSEAKTTEPKRTETNKPADSGTASGGKTLTKSPSMGGAFNPDDL